MHRILEYIQAKHYLSIPKAWVRARARARARARVRVGVRVRPRAGVDAAHVLPPLFPLFPP